MKARRLRIAIDAEHFRQSDAGIGRYARSLTRSLLALGKLDVIEVGGGPTEKRGTLSKRLTTLRQDLVWYPWRGRAAARAIHADVYHCPSPRAPLLRGRPPLVITVHDLVALRFPETTTPWSRLYGRLTLRRALAAADRIITPSSDTADDVVRLAGIPADRVRVVHNGIDERFFLPAQSREAEGRPYVLFVGTPEPRKNLKRLFEAMTLLRARGFEATLRIAGSNGWGAPLPNDPGVEWMGRVDDETLCSLYANASCLAIPSLHEGFGFPALEAMAAGTPVVAARAGALPEIVGNAGVMVDPVSVSSIADGIARAISERQDFISLGKMRAAAFTWEKCAERTAELYGELA